MRAPMSATMPGSPRTGAEWSVPYIASSAPSGPCHLPHPLGELRGPLRQMRRILEEMRSVAVAAGRQVLGPQSRAVGRDPGEDVGHHGRRHTPVDAGVEQPGPPQDLRHLRRVTEHVGQVPHRHGPAELVGPVHAEFEVAHDVLARAQELVEQDLPRPDRQPPGLDQRGDAVAVLRPDLQVVVHAGQLPVEGEVVVGLALHRVEHLVEQRHQPQPEALEGLVPLPVPVRVRDDDDFGGHAASPPMGRSCCTA